MAREIAAAKDQIRGVIVTSPSQKLFRPSQVDAFTWFDVYMLE